METDPYTSELEFLKKELAKTRRKIRELKLRLNTDVSIKLSWYHQN